MFFVTTFMIQIAIAPFQSVNIDRSGIPSKILHANDSLLYFEDAQGELGPIVGYNYKSNNYFGNINIGRGPLEIELELPPKSIYYNNLFFITDRTQNKVVVCDKKLNPIWEYISQAELVQLSYKSGDREVTMSLSPSQPLLSITDSNDSQIAPRVNDSYLMLVELSYIMRQFRVRAIENICYSLLRFTDYSVIYNPITNELKTFRFNIFDELPNPKKYITESPDHTDYPVGGLDLAIRNESGRDFMYVLFKREKASKLGVLFKIFSNDESFVDEVSHSDTIYKFAVEWESEKVTLLETYQTTVPVNSIFFHGENLLALTYLNVEVPQLLFFQVK